MLLVLGVAASVLGAYGFFLAFERPFMSKRLKAGIEAEMKS